MGDSRIYGGQPKAEPTPPDSRYVQIMPRVLALDAGNTAALLDHLIHIHKTDSLFLACTEKWLRENAPKKKSMTLEELQEITELVKSAEQFVNGK